MLKSVWKFELPKKAGAFDLEMPEWAKLLNLDVQSGTPCLWALVNPGRDREIRTFVLRTTGEDWAGKTGDYIGTVILSGGAYVLHLFEI